MVANLRTHHELHPTPRINKHKVDNPRVGARFACFRGLNLEDQGGLKVDARELGVMEVVAVGHSSCKVQWLSDGAEDVWEHASFGQDLIAHPIKTRKGRLELELG